MLKGLRILFFCFFIGTNFKDTHCVFADHYDVKMPCHLILSKLADKCPSAVLAGLFSSVEVLSFCCIASLFSNLDFTFSVRFIG